MRDLPPALVDAITSALVEADAAGEIVLAVTTPAQIAERIGEKVREVFVGGIFTPEELMALSGLIFEATSDKRFSALLADVVSSLRCAYGAAQRGR